MPLAESVLTHVDELDKYAVEQDWLFRGVQKIEYPLESSFDRCCRREDIKKDDRATFEKALIRDFRRAYHHYEIRKPTSDLEWLSIMQHHGAPTRLVDFTYSGYIAAYFAIVDAEEDCAVWAVNRKWALWTGMDRLKASGRDSGLCDQYCDVFFDVDREIYVVNELFLTDSGVRMASPINPFHLNQRLRLQKGLFLIPGDVSYSFLDNLMDMAGWDDPKNLIKLIIPRSIRRNLQRRLFNMNIAKTSLFPGLDGYAASMGGHLPLIEQYEWK